MPIVNTVRGDLISRFKAGEFASIAHGCNCQKMMAAGIAAQIAQHFPEAVAADNDSTGGPDKLGALSTGATDWGFVFNLYTQEHPGRVHDTKKLLGAVSACFERLNTIIQTIPFATAEEPLGIPMIGSGIAGGHWPDIEHAIHEAAPLVPIVVVEYVPQAARV